MVSSGIMTNTKCRLSSPLFFSDFNLNGSLNIAGIREKLEYCVCLGRHGKKTDILDLFLHFSTKVISECFNWCAGMYARQTNSEKKLLWQTLFLELAKMHAEKKPLSVSGPDM